MTVQTPSSPPAPPYPDKLAGLFQSHPDSAFDYLEFRLAIARMAARLAAERATEEDRSQITQAFQSLCQVHDEDQGDAELQADADFHQIIYKACHNAVMGFVMSTLITMQRRSVFYDRLKLYEQPSARPALMEQHRALYQAIMDRDGDRAAEAAETHIRFAGHALREAMEADRRLQASIRRRNRALHPESGPFLEIGTPPAKRRRNKNKED
jgi:GntR family transcriptional repressor for pyruvate dehydrogenase complex